MLKLAHGDPEYAQLLLDIGDGIIDPIVEDYIPLDERIVSKAKTVETFIDEVFADGLETVHVYCFWNVINIWISSKRFFICTLHVHSTN